VKKKNVGTFAPGIPKIRAQAATRTADHAETLGLIESRVLLFFFSKA
jgi:hypothetical protein